jgi:hypothetical protein
MRVTNLIRKAHCALAQERWSNGRRVDLRQHMAGAEKRGVPFLLLKGHRLELLPLLEAVRPLLVRRGIVRERTGARRAARLMGGGGDVDGGLRGGSDGELEEDDEWDEGEE